MLCPAPATSCPRMRAGATGNAAAGRDTAKEVRERAEQDADLEEMPGDIEDLAARFLVGQIATTAWADRLVYSSGGDGSFTVRARHLPRDRGRTGGAGYRCRWWRIHLLVKIW